MKLRAVIFDYGEVLSGPPDQVAHRLLVETSGLPEDVFEKHYWAFRSDYDAGVLTGSAYWKKLAQEAGVEFSYEQLIRLAELDVLMWTNVNEGMLAWVGHLHDVGLRIGILSNMGDEILRYMRQEFGWLGLFQHHTWSCELGIVKPDPEIYRHTIEKLKVRPEEALFIDNIEANVEGAKAVGLHGIVFQNIDQLHRDLRDGGYNLPLPQLSMA